ncbi:MAG: hypothetical protein JZU50_15070 [Desulfobulbaceae bacterium]|nr:hypothetical protein [Desulfobulbaceae bacterium]
MDNFDFPMPLPAEVNQRGFHLKKFEKILFLLEDICEATSDVALENYASNVPMIRPGRC